MAAGNDDKFLQRVTQQPLPEWLAAAGEPLSTLPLHDLLSGSVYYPACRLDGQPVKFLAGSFYSFVYVDYGVTYEHHLELLRSSGQEPRERFHNAIEARDHLGFRGYRLLAWRHVEKHELTPRGWVPHPLRPEDGVPPTESPLEVPPFAVWSVLERLEGFDDSHGPARFSLLYVGGDAVASFDAMYLGNKVAPVVVAVIQPGTGFGGNWATLEDPNGVFARLVRENPAGFPRYLLFGGWGDGEAYANPCWPDYAEHVFHFTGRLGLWQRAEQ